MEPRERRQERGVDVHDAIGKCFDKIRGQKSHETRQDDQLNLSVPQSFNHLLIECLPGGIPTMVDHFRGNTMSLGTDESVGILTVADHHANLGMEMLLFYGIDDGLEIAAISRDQHTQWYLPRHSFKERKTLPLLPLLILPRDHKAAPST